MRGRGTRPIGGRRDGFFLAPEMGETATRRFEAY
jgi:hypothetical protein